MVRTQSSEMSGAGPSPFTNQIKSRARSSLGPDQVPGELRRINSAYTASRHATSCISPIETRAARAQAGATRSNSGDSESAWSLNGQCDTVPPCRSAGFSKLQWIFHPKFECCVILRNSSESLPGFSPESCSGSLVAKSPPDDPLPAKSDHSTGKRQFS